MAPQPKHKIYNKPSDTVNVFPSPICWRHLHLLQQPLKHSPLLLLLLPSLFASLYCEATEISSQRLLLHARASLVHPCRPLLLGCCPVIPTTAAEEAAGNSECSRASGSSCRAGDPVVSTGSRGCLTQVPTVCCQQQRMATCSFLNASFLSFAD